MIFFTVFKANSTLNCFLLVTKNDNFLCLCQLIESRNNLLLIHEHVKIDKKVLTKCCNLSFHFYVRAYKTFNINLPFLQTYNQLLAQSKFKLQVIVQSFHLKLIMNCHLVICQICISVA